VQNGLHLVVPWFKIKKIPREEAGHMSLTCEELMKFDLAKRLDQDTDKFIKFYSITSAIRNVDTFIRDTPSFPGSTDKIIRGELISVVGATLSIEGTLLEKEEIEESFQKADKGEPLKRKEQEAENSRRAYYFLKEVKEAYPSGIIFSEQLIKQIHKLLTNDMNYLSSTPGAYRSFNVSFGQPRKNSLCATQTDVESVMRLFIEWLNAKSESWHPSTDQFVKAIMAHYYLTEIHPFGDGNGRTARALEALILYDHGVNDYCFWSLANFWSTHKDHYLAHLHQIRQTSDPTDFILWGLEGYREEIINIKVKVMKKLKQLMFSDYLQYLLRNKAHETIKLNKRLMAFLQLLIAKGRVSSDKFYSSPEVIALYHKVSKTTRIRDLRTMLSHQLIKTSRDGKELFMEPNFGLLDGLWYKV